MYRRKKCEPPHATRIDTIESCLTLSKNKNGLKQFTKSICTSEAFVLEFSSAVLISATKVCYIKANFVSKL